jgi:hypothetical protein
MYEVGEIQVPGDLMPGPPGYLKAALAGPQARPGSRCLFPASPVSPHALRPNHANARSCAAINKDIDDFVTWVNTAFCRADGTLPIPPDPTKHLHATRLRRTLAYFIVRRPAG